MPYSNDLADALLFAAAHKGVPTLQSTTTTATGGPITYNQVKAGYNNAMKSNPNPYGPQNSQLDLKSGINIIIHREVLPACVKDISGTDDFDLWTWHGFEETLTGGPSGYITARHIKTNAHYQRRFYFSRSVLDDYLHTNNADALFSLIDAEMLQTVEAIVLSALPPHDINTCTDPECYC